MALYITCQKCYGVQYVLRDFHHLQYINICICVLNSVAIPQCLDKVAVMALQLSEDELFQRPFL